MTATETTTTVVVPGTHLMSALVGPRDQHLRQIEDAFPRTDINVRGNEVTARGERSDQVGRLFEELVGLLQRGHELDEASLRRVIGMIDDDERPSEILTQDVLRGAKGRQIRPKSAGQKRYIDAIDRERHHVRHRPGRHRQVVARRGHGRQGAAGQAGPADHPHPAGRRGRRAARLPAR